MRGCAAPISATDCRTSANTFATEPRCRCASTSSPTLITAREWTSQYEWYAHYPLAMKAGLDAKVADELALGKRPSAMSDDEAAVYEFCIQLHRTRNVDDETFNRALVLFGERGVVDLIGVSGYYAAVSMTLNVAQVMPPEGTPPPLK